MRVAGPQAGGNLQPSGRKGESFTGAVRGVEDNSQGNEKMTRRVNDK